MNGIPLSFFDARCGKSSYTERDENASEGKRVIATKMQRHAKTGRFIQSFPSYSSAHGERRVIGRGENGKQTDLAENTVQSWGNYLTNDSYRESALSYRFCIALCTS